MIGCSARPRKACCWWAGPESERQPPSTSWLLRPTHVLRNRTPCGSPAATHIVAGMSGFGMWQQRCQELCQEAAKSRVIVHVGNLMELLQTGQSEGSDLGIGEFLRPAIVRGQLLAIAECTPEEYAVVERRYPGMLQAFVRLDVEEPSAEQSRQILRQATEQYSQWEHAWLDDAAIAVLDRLHRRFATYSAYPGRPLRFLKHLLEDAAHDQTVESPDVTRAFSAETGLPLHLLDDGAPLDLAATRSWFQQRLVGQDKAIDAVVDLLATIKADLARPDRPLASLLFIGPTGVGKTEMAKTLAEFLYSDRQRLIRIDMTEYADGASIDRLIGAYGQNEGILTSRVREQPFGIVLLDEFEKAHPRFFDMLLQVLGEGRLTDGAGRLADFRNSVIIMTSNLGAESFGRAAPGFGRDGADEQKTHGHFEARVREFLRPEMFNRLDRVVTFLPLSRSVLHDITRRELERLQQRDGVRYRPLAMQFDASLAPWLVDRSYDPRYGARPLQRAIERHLFAPLAGGVNEYQGERPLSVDVVPGAQRLRVQIRHAATDRIGPGDVGESQQAVGWADTVRQCVELRRYAYLLDRCDGMQELHNNLYRWRREQYRQQRRQQRGQQRQGRGQTQSAPNRHLDTLIASVEPLVTRVQDTVRRCVELENQALEAWHLGQAVDRRQLAASVGDQSRQLDQLARGLFSQQFDQPHYVLLAVYGEESQWLKHLAEAYGLLAAAQELRVEAFALETYAQPPDPDPDLFLLGDRKSPDDALRRQANETSLLARRAESVRHALTEASSTMIGVALSITGPCSWLLLEPEQGLHVWRDATRKRQCLVHVSQAIMAGYQPPLRIDRRGTIGAQKVRRTWNQMRRQVEDPQLGQSVFWDAELPGSTLPTLVAQRLSERVKEWLRS